MISEVWLVMTDANSWGKSTDYFKEALANALKHASRMNPVRQIHIYRFTNADAEGVEVDGLGNVTYPKGATMKKLARVDLPPALLKAFTAFDDEVEEFEQLQAFCDTFD